MWSVSCFFFISWQWHLPAASPVVSIVKSSSASATLPLLSYSFNLDDSTWMGDSVESLPDSFFHSNGFKTLFNGYHVNVLSPCFLSFTTGLEFLCYCCVGHVYAAGLSERVEWSREFFFGSLVSTQPARLIGWIPSQPHRYISLCISVIPYPIDPVYIH